MDITLLSSVSRELEFHVCMDNWVVYSFDFTEMNSVEVVSLLCRRKKTAREARKDAPVKRSDSFGNKKELVIRRTGSLKRNKR